MTHTPLPPALAADLARRPPDEARALAHAWNALDALPEPPDVPADGAAWTDLEARLGLHAAAVPSRRAPDRTPLRAPSMARTTRRALVAACVAVVAMVAWGGLRPVTVVAGPQAQARVALPDGSEAVLNSGARLRYARGFGAWRRAGTRAVHLDGEAFFDVATASRPFVVSTGTADVAVLGTRFNVRAWPGEPTRVTLEEGRVRVAARAGGAAVTLAPGQATDVADGPPSAPSAADPARAAAWRGGGFTAENLPLAAVLADVERRFGVTVRAASGVPLEQPVTLYYGDGVTAETVLHDLALAAGLRYRPLRGGFDLLPADAP